jgi:hypothetical protein
MNIWPRNTRALLCLNSHPLLRRSPKPGGHRMNRHSLSKQAGTTKLSLTASVIEPNGVMFIKGTPWQNVLQQKLTSSCSLSLFQSVFVLLVPNEYKLLSHYRNRDCFNWPWRVRVEGLKDGNIDSILILVLTSHNLLVGRGCLLIGFGSKSECCQRERKKISLF